MLQLFLSRPFETTAFSLTPSTAPEQVIQSQLQSLQEDDMPKVYSFASPRNKMQVGESVERFAQMVQNANGPYRYLIRHESHQLLLESTMAASRQYLVRIIPNAKEYPTSPPRDYWWSLSRCPTRELAGCFLVDAVLPTS